MKNLKFIIVFYLLVSKFTFGQNKQITLDSALQIASKNNLQVKNEKIKLAYYQKLTETSRNIPFTNIVGDFGQINSRYFDTRFSVSQAFSLPKVYQAQRNVLFEEMKAVELGVLLKEVELKKAVTETFYNLRYIQEKETLRQKYETIYLEFLQKANLRLSKGESNILEKTIAQEQLDKSTFLKLKLDTENELCQLRLKFLLNIEINLEPIGNIKYLAFEKANSTLLLEHPQLKILEQHRKIGQTNTDLEKSKTLPTFSLGYSNGSIRGVGADNLEYGGFNRFHSMQIGIGIPLFQKAQKAKIGALQISQQVLESEQKLGFIVLENDYLLALSQYKGYTEAIKYFEEKVIPNSKIIEQIAQQQFSAGTITYTDWLSLMNQSQNVQNEYFDTLKLANDTSIKINYFVSK